MEKDCQYDNVGLNKLGLQEYTHTNLQLRETIKGKLCSYYIHMDIKIWYIFWLNMNKNQQDYKVT